MSMVGNPDLKRAQKLNTYIYYSLQSHRFELSAICQYVFSQNPVVNTYNISGGKVLKSYDRNGSIHYFSAIVGATYSLSKALKFSGDVRYNHTTVDSWLALYNNDLTANLKMVVYAGDFAIKPHLKLRKRMLDQATFIRTRIPLNYGVSCSYSRKNFFAEIQFESPFSSREICNEITTPYYACNTSVRNKMDSHYCNIKLSYSLDFGHKTGKVERDINSKIDSSLLHVDE
jgi:hypothetical protein